MTSTARTPVEVEPIARVLPMLSVPHLDREFDYLVSAEQSDDAQPGVRVRVRFHGRLVDGFVLERRNDTDHLGKLGWLDRVVSAEPVLTAEIRRWSMRWRRATPGPGRMCCVWRCRPGTPGWNANPQRPPFGGR